MKKQTKRNTINPVSFHTHTPVAVTRSKLD